MKGPRKVFVVTGAGAGVGRAVARELGAREARVGLVGRNREALDAAATEIAHAGGEALVCLADVADAAQVTAAADAVEQRFGPIDVWINNAMATIVAPAAQLEPGEVQRVTDVTYVGAVHGTIVALRRMLPRDRGTIVQVGSALAYRSIPLQAPYCGAKAALRGFTDALRSELIRDGSRVRVTMVHLPGHDTPQFDWCRTKMDRAPRPVPPVFDPAVAARAIVRAVEHHRREWFVGGSTFAAVIGTKFIPGLLDRHLAGKAYDAQRSGEPVGPGRPDNLFASPPGDRGAHASFASQSKRFSVFTLLDRHRSAIAALALMAAAALALGGRQRLR